MNQAKDRLTTLGYFAGLGGDPCEFTGRGELNRAAWENGWREGHKAREAKRIPVKREAFVWNQEAKRGSAFASDLGIAPGVQPELMKMPWGTHEATWTTEEAEIHDGSIQAWIMRPDAPTLRMLPDLIDWRIIIFNT